MVSVPFSLLIIHNTRYREGCIFKKVAITECAFANAFHAVGIERFSNQQNSAYRIQPHYIYTL